MQFSKRVSELSRLYGIDPKEVLFAMLATCPGVSTVEAFAVIYKPTSTTNSAISTRASQYIGQRPGLRKLIDELNADRSDNPGQPTPRRGRPRKEAAADIDTTDTPRLDYTDKDAVLQELARIAERSEKESDKLAAIREISALQRMKQEAAVEDEKRVQFYIPLTYDRAEELRQYLVRYYAEKDGNTES